MCECGAIRDERAAVDDEGGGSGALCATGADDVEGALIAGKDRRVFRRIGKFRAVPTVGKHACLARLWRRLSLFPSQA